MIITQENKLRYLNMKTATEYIKESWKLYFKKENFIFFARIMSVLVLSSVAVGFISGYFYPEDYLKNGDFSNVPMLVGFVLLSLTTALISLWSQTTTYVAVLKIGSDEKEVLRIGFKKIGKFLLISLTLGLIAFGGIILLIIPAVIFGVWYSFATFFVMDSVLSNKNMKIREALKASKSLVVGKFWKILGRSIVFGLFSFVVTVIVSVVPYVGTVAVSFLAPLFILPFYLLYRDLSAN